jgi:hypothetical protein
MRVRDEAAELRADPFGEHLIVHRSAPHEAAKRCRGSIRSMKRIATRRADCAARQRSRVRDRIPNARAPACAAVWIQKIRETGSHPDASQQRTAVFHDSSSLHPHQAT